MQSICWKLHNKGWELHNNSWPVPLLTCALQVLRRQQQSC